jgi:hypothetical protein
VTETIKSRLREGKRKFWEVTHARHSPVVNLHTGINCARAGTGLTGKTAKDTVNTRGMKALVFMTRHVPICGV